MDQSFFYICDKFLLLNRICFDPAELKKQLLSQEDYPSLKSFTDVLTTMKVEHRALKIGWDQLIEYDTPVMLHYQGRMPSFVMATHITPNEITYVKSNSKKVTKSQSDFLAHWDGVALYIIEPDSFSRKCFLINLFKRYRIWLWVAVASLLLLSFFRTRSIQMEGFEIGIFFLKIIGLFFSILLLRHDCGKRSKTEQHLCTLTQSFSCHAVLSSKASKLFGMVKMSDIGMVYFSGGLICMLLSFHGIIDRQRTLSLLEILSFCSFPYILFSLSYQRFKVKKWCPLCLGVLTILSIEILLSGIRTTICDLQFPPLHDCYMAGLFFLTLALSWHLLSDFIKAYLKIEEKEIRYLALKRNRSVLQAMLNRQEPMNMSFSEEDILIGNPKSQTKVTIAINPFCTPCLELYEQLQGLLEQSPDAFCLNIRFMSMDEEARNRQVGLRLATLYYQNPTLFIEALNFWKKDKAYNDFQQRFGNWPFSEKAKQTLAKHFAWREKIRLDHTPAIFIGNRKLPDIYTNEDLFYFLKFDHYKVNIK